MEKYFHLPGSSRGGHPYIHLVEPGTGYGLDQTCGLEKTASGEHLSGVISLIEAIQPSPGRLYLVNSALGSGEFVGFNLRGDWFTEAGILHTPPGWDQIPVWDIDGRRRGASLTEHVPGWGDLVWGYPTFYNAHRFRHHVNKDPNRAYGLILGAFWDPRMHRVILVSELIEEFCRRLGAIDIYERIRRNDFPDTSMGAKVPFDRCFPAGTLIWTENGYLPIENLRQGDPVHTLENLVRPVDVPMSSRFTGALISIRPSGLPAFETTANHPVFRIQREEVRSCRGSANGKKRRHTPGPANKCVACGAHLGWIPLEVPAEDLRVGDYLLTPVESHGQEDPSPEMAYLVGVYAGDGFIVRQRTGKKKDGPYRNMGLGFSCNSTDPHIDRLTAAISSLSINEPRSYDEGEERQAVSIRVYDQDLAAEALRLLGEKWDSKGLRQGVFASQSARLSFLGGVIDSDGCFDDLTGNIRITTGNKALAYDLWQTCVCSGIAASLYSHMSKGGFSESTEIWVVFIPGSYSTELSEFSEKVQAIERGQSTQSFFWNGYLCSPIKGLEGREVEDFVVYNLDVEGDDETYVAAGVAVHNCSICNHIAKTPREYCDCVKSGALHPYGMRAILPDGRMCGVYNDYPRFFDDSFVFIGAERSAKVLANVTDKVKGQRPYSSKVYTPSRMHVKAASAPSLPLSEMEEREVQLAKGLSMAGAPRPMGASGHSIGSKISRMLSVVPVIHEQEQMALQHAADRARRQAAIRDGATDPAELKFWEQRELHKLRGKGVTQEQIDRMRAIVNYQMAHAYGEKLGAAAKWAEHLKMIPVPSSAQMALLRDHVGRFPQLARGDLDRISGALPANLSAAARHGIVLRPEEFQYCMLRAMGAPQVAEVCITKRILFTPVPVDPTYSPRFRVRNGTPLSPPPISDSMILRRSFAPRAVKYRILFPMQKAPAEEVSTLEDVDLNKVAQVYNDYRIGLLARPPDLRHVEIPLPTPVPIDQEAKLASTAAEMSSLLLRLAYWPSLPIG